MMLTVYGRATSSNVQAVMWTIGELALEHERLDRGHAYGGVDTPEYLAMNPNGLVPVVVDGDRPPLWESYAIVRYLAEKYGDTDFWPTDPMKRAQAAKWADWIKTTFGPVLLIGIFWPLITDGIEATGNDALATNVAKIGGLAKIADGAVAGRDYLGGDTPCFADMVFGSLLYRYFTLAFDRVETRDLSAYYDRLGRRPAYREHVMVSYDALKAK